jgi:hypothetical protein
MASLKLDEIKSVIKMGEFEKRGTDSKFGEAFQKGGRRSFCSKMFLQWLRRFNTTAKLIIHQRYPR